MDSENIFLASPSFNGLIDYRTARSLYQTASQKHKVMIMSMQNSLLAHGFNQMYAYALNNREKYGLKWFAMLHADIVPDPWWLDTLVQTALEHNADLLSAVVPIKDTRGLTSTALSLPYSNYGCMLRLSLKQIDSLPETFDINSITLKKIGVSIPIEADSLRKLFSLDSFVTQPIKLLVNTGCMILRLDRDWSECIHFKIDDCITKKDSVFYAQVEPEDWRLSRSVSDFGGHVFATTSVKVKHIGSTSFDTHTVWGESFDPDFIKTNL